MEDVDDILWDLDNALTVAVGPRAPRLTEVTA
jgi:hypothetical protein